MPGSAESWWPMVGDAMSEGMTRTLSCRHCPGRPRQIGQRPNCSITAIAAASTALTITRSRSRCVGRRSDGYQALLEIGCEIRSLMSAKAVLYRHHVSGYVCLGRIVALKDNHELPSAGKPRFLSLATSRFLGSHLVTFPSPTAAESIPASTPRAPCHQLQQFC